MLTDAGVRRPGPEPDRGDGRPGPNRPGSPSLEPAAGQPDAAVRPAAGPVTWALAGLTLASSAGLFRVFSGGSWIGPVLATIAATHLALWAMRRWRFGPFVAAPLALLAVALMVIWTVFGSATTLGFPGPHAWSQLARSVGNVGTDFSTMVAPVRPTRGFLVLACGGAGLVAIVGDWAAFRWRSPLIAVVAGLAAFVAGCTAGQGAGRGWIIGLEVGAICLFLLVERAAAHPGQVWFAGTRSGSARWAATAGGGAAALALVAAVALTPALANRDGVGALGWRAGGAGGGGERIVPNPIVTLRTRLIQFSNTPVFMVDSSVPSYWRLTSLDTFNGDTWTATGAYRDFGTRLPGSPPAGTGTRTVRAAFQIQQLDSVWLPEQFTPVSVRGVGRVSYDPNSGSLITSSATSNGLTYSVDSVQFLDTLSAAALESAPPVGAAPALSSDLELPAVVDGPITQLAAQITAGRPTEYDKALAIQDYLRSTRFSYSLNPPSDGSGASALYNFLFITRQGYCQQFAGAYAVLARAAGLPTRLAVGFATGNPVAGGGFQVFDRDAHTWPEVYFGPQYGWLPFEPTPGFSVPGTGGYTGIQSPGNGPSVTVPTTVPAGSSAAAPPVHKGGSPTTRRTGGTTLPPAGPRSSGTGAPVWILAVLAGPALVVLWGAGNTGLRRASRRRRRLLAERSGPAATVLELWDEVGAELAWSGISRHPTETDDEFAGRAVALLDGPTVAGRAPGGALATLASLARQASFAPAVPPDAVDRARAAARDVHRQLAGHVTTGDRIRRWLSLPPGRWAYLTRMFRPG